MLNSKTVETLGNGDSIIVAYSNSEEILIFRHNNEDGLILDIRSKAPDVEYFRIRHNNSSTNLENASWFSFGFDLGNGKSAIYFYLIEDNKWQSITTVNGFRAENWYPFNSGKVIVTEAYQSSNIYSYNEEIGQWDRLDIPICGAQQGYQEVWSQKGYNDYHWICDAEEPFIIKINEVSDQIAVTKILTPQELLPTIGYEGQDDNLYLMGAPKNSPDYEVYMYDAETSSWISSKVMKNRGASTQDWRYQLLAMVENEWNRVESRKLSVKSKNRDWISLNSKVFNDLYNFVGVVDSPKALLVLFENKDDSVSAALFVDEDNDWRVYDRFKKDVSFNRPVKFWVDGEDVVILWDNDELTRINPSGEESGDLIPAEFKKKRYGFGGIGDLIIAPNDVGFVLMSNINGIEILNTRPLLKDTSDQYDLAQIIKSFGGGSVGAAITQLKNKLDLSLERHKFSSELVGEIEGNLKQIKESAVEQETEDPWNQQVYIQLTRLTLVAILFFLVQIFANQFRYTNRLARFYTARTDALKLVTVHDMQITPEQFDILVNTLSPDGLDMGKMVTSSPHQLLQTNFLNPIKK